MQPGARGGILTPLSTSTSLISLLRSNNNNNNKHKPVGRPSCSLATTPYTIIAHLHANSNAGSAEKLYHKLLEAARVHRQNAETISWFVMRDIYDHRAFIVVERYVSESICAIHSLSTIYACTYKT